MVADEPLMVVEHSAARTRILDAALELFARHGVSATSLQMIADAIGVTKAAVTISFRPGSDRPRRDRARTRLAGAGAGTRRGRGAGPPARDELLVVVIEMAVRDRRLVSTLQFDPVVVKLLAEHEPFRGFMARLYGVHFADAGEDARLEAAMLAGAISSAVMNPLAADIDDDTRAPVSPTWPARLIGLPEGPPPVTADLRQVIASAPMFGGLDAAHVDLLAGQSRPIFLPAGQVLFRRGRRRPVLHRARRPDAAFGVEFRGCGQGRRDPQPGKRVRATR